MKVWVKSAGNNYIHVFTGKRDSEDPHYIIVDKSLIQYGDHVNGRYFAHPGKKIMMGKHKEYDYEDIKHEIIHWIFKGEILISPELTFKVLG